MDLEWNGDVAVVVGGANGLGWAIAEAFACEGVHVALVDLDPAAETRAAQLATLTGVHVTGITADVTDYDAMQAARDSMIETHSRCDHLVFAAGVGSGRFGFPFWNLEPHDWQNCLQVNLIGAVNVVHAFAEHFQSAGTGSILFLASVAGQIGSQTDPPYSAAKAGLINFAQCAAKDFAPYEIRVNTICPGMVKTALNQAVWQAWSDGQPPALRRSYDEWAAAKIKQLVPLGRWQDAADIANMAVFLASQRAKNITGQTINVDGGFVMHW